jgi:hypothetical protein
VVAVFGGIRGRSWLNDVHLLSTSKYVMLKYYATQMEHLSLWQCAAGTGGSRCVPRARPQPHAPTTAPLVCATHWYGLAAHGTCNVITPIRKVCRLSSAATTAPLHSTTCTCSAPCTAQAAP